MGRFANWVNSNPWSSKAADVAIGVAGSQMVPILGGWGANKWFDGMDSNYDKRWGWRHSNAGASSQSSPQSQIDPWWDQGVQNYPWKFRR